MVLYWIALYFMVFLFLYPAPLNCISMHPTEGRQAETWVWVVMLLADIYRRICTILNTTFITFKSPLWIDHLLGHVIQVVPKRKIESSTVFVGLEKDWD